MDNNKVEDENQRNINDGDWICPDSQCANVNFARRNSCNRCGKDRGECPKKKKLGQEIGKAAAEKSRGLFSADDWQCSKCGNVNWARRQQCNMCNAPKFGEIEERTGYGGGYNDRGVVEYKERRDDDDEYDEFGRRRKKRKIENRSDDDSKDSRMKMKKRKMMKKMVIYLNMILVNGMTLQLRKIQMGALCLQKNNNQETKMTGAIREHLVNENMCRRKGERKFQE
ncbi:zinc finger Ran-binding domain-containing protein 2 isoform X2 [Apis cerana]|uniref:zinc finger Ran-binding domain-containing protein 2 isoform X2 n=1 Tax=Apis cerana TaxID=7461 RepID=UPI0007E2C223|nr:zinc finger Ran-binding domain-containing protein 2 isoform X2 [Apis cerana]